MTGIDDFLWGAIATLSSVLGFALVFYFLRIVNLAHGEFMTIGSYVHIACADMGIPNYVALPLAAVVAAVPAWFFFYFILQPLRHRSTDAMLATLGLALLLRELLHLWTDPIQRTVFAPPILGVHWAVFCVVFVVVAVLLFYIWFRGSRVALKLRAFTETPMLAETGCPQADYLFGAIFVFASATAGVAGAMMAPMASVTPDISDSYMFLSSFAALFGVLASFWGVISGSVLLGIFDSHLPLVPTQGKSFLYMFLFVLSLIWFSCRSKKVYP